MESEEIFPVALFFVLLVIGGVASIIGIYHTCIPHEKEVVNVSTFEKEFYDKESNKTFVVTVSVDERKN